MGYLLVMSSVDSDKLCAIFLVKEIVDNAHLGIAASLVCIINGKCRARIPDANARVAAIAPDVWVITLRRARCPVGVIVDIWCIWRAAIRPSWIAGRLT